MKKLWFLFGMLWSVTLWAQEQGTMCLRPYEPARWTKVTLPVEYVEPVTEAQAKTFAEVEALMQRKAHRQGLWQHYVQLMHWQESVPSLADVRFKLEVGAQDFLFDRFGRIYVDGRFIQSDEMPVIEALEALYAELLMRSPYPVMAPEAKILVKANVRAGRKIRIFRGFEDTQYQLHDDLVVRLVSEFNADPAKWADATVEQAESIHELSPSLIKALMIEESAAMPGRRPEAWTRDPMQINIPHNWRDWKVDIGLTQPTERNTGTPEQNIRAGIMYLVRKGFDVSGKPAREFPDKEFEGWVVALKRYNGRVDGTTDGRKYKSAFAERIATRFSEPDNFSPVVIALP